MVDLVRNVNDGPSAGFAFVLAKAEAGFDGRQAVALFVTFAKMKRGNAVIKK